MISTSRETFDVGKLRHNRPQCSHGHQRLKLAHRARGHLDAAPMPLPTDIPPPVMNKTDDDRLSVAPLWPLTSTVRDTSCCIAHAECETA